MENSEAVVRRCSVKFVKFLRTASLQTTCERMKIKSFPAFILFPRQSPAADVSGNFPPVVSTQDLNTGKELFFYF